MLDGSGSASAMGTIGDESNKSMPPLPTSPFYKQYHTWRWKKLIGAAFSGVKPLASRLAWPKQGKPSNNDWRTWRRFLRREFLHAGDALNLCQALGAWVPTATCHHRQWRKHYHPQEVCILRNGEWRLYKFRQRRRHPGKVETVSTHCEQPEFGPVTFDSDTLQTCFFRQSNQRLQIGSATWQQLQPPAQFFPLVNLVMSSHLELEIATSTIQWKLTSGDKKWFFQQAMGCLSTRLSF